LSKLLVLGSEGFIGKHIVKLAIKRNYEVTGIDIIDRLPIGYRYEKLSLLGDDLDKYLYHNKFDFVINCSGSGNVAFSIKHSLTDFDLNTRSVKFILEAIRHNIPEAKYIHLSSAAVYGRSQILPIAETAKLNPISPYGYHKLLSETICEEYSVLHGIPISIVRPFSVYGPGLRKQLLWDIYQKGKLSNEVELWGSGEETRDFIFVEDLAKAIFLVANTKHRDLQLYNLANGVSITIKIMAEKLFHALEWNRKLSFNGFIREGDPRFWQADINRLSALSYLPDVDLTKGLEQTAKWLLENEK
jgi:nucleoside-diphosphate-sugar epimerase